MNTALCLSIRFIQPFPLFHGRSDAEKPEWPPSPMRTFQALLNAACLRARGRPLAPEIRQALQALEVLQPQIISPRATVSTVGFRAYVPHNQTDLVTAAWHRGNLDASIASHRMEKDYRPVHIEMPADDLPTLHYLYPLNATNLDPLPLLAAVRPIVRSIHCLGWGIDQVIADITLVDQNNALLNIGERWLPSSVGGRPLRIPTSGTLDALISRHEKFLKRLINNSWTPVPSLRAFDVIRYRCLDQPIQRPSCVFELRNGEGSRFRYPYRKLIHIAGMVRHLAIKTMKHDPPRDTDQDWVEKFVAGHAKAGLHDHRQFSYLPLPSVGYEHTDPDVRRVMITAPVGDGAWLDHLARRLAGQTLKPLRGDEFAGREPPLLVPVRYDNIGRSYTREASIWHSFTPVILPGHDDHKPTKTRSLIEKALRQSGVEQPCDFEWSAFPHFRKSLPAQKYDRDKQQEGYFRPAYLDGKTGVHLTLRFHDGSNEKNPIKVPGPIAIGAGRHCGLGVFVASE